jgi:hypothetical protein
MNEVSGGKQDMASTSAWDAMMNQPVTTIPSMHHLNPALSQDSSTPVTQVIVPTPVKLQAPILSPPPIVADHCSILGHVQQSPIVAQVHLIRETNGSWLLTPHTRLWQCLLLLIRWRHHQASQNPNSL